MVLGGTGGQYGAVLLGTWWPGFSIEPLYAFIVVKGLYAFA